MERPYSPVKRSQPPSLGALVLLAPDRQLLGLVFVCAGTDESLRTNGTRFYILCQGNETAQVQDKRWIPSLSAARPTYPPSRNC